jgi:hypothetical protein
MLKHYKWSFNSVGTQCQINLVKSWNSTSKEENKCKEKAT